MASLAGDKELKRLLRRAGKDILTYFKQPISDAQSQIAMTAQLTVPSDSGALAQSAFVDGPKLRSSRLSVSATVGYEAPYAGAVHEGVHFGKQLEHPPKWLEQAAQDIGDQKFTENMRQAAWAGLQDLARKKSGG